MNSKVILPALLEQSHTRIWMKGLIRLWCKSVAWLLGIHSYLLGDELEPEANERGDQPENNENVQGLFNGLGAVHQALLPRDGPIEVQPYQRPTWFCVRLIGKNDLPLSLTLFSHIFINYIGVQVFSLLSASPLS